MCSSMQITVSFRLSCFTAGEEWGKEEKERKEREGLNRRQKRNTKTERWVNILKEKCNGFVNKISLSFLLLH